MGLFWKLPPEITGEYIEKDNGAEGCKGRDEVASTP
jgi:hypothetical protein